MNLCGFVWFLFKFRRPVQHVLLYCCKFCEGGSGERRAVGAVWIKWSYSCGCDMRAGVRHVLLYCCELCEGGSGKRRAVGAVWIKWCYSCGCDVTRGAELEMWRWWFVNNEEWNESNMEKWKQCQTAPLKESDSSWCCEMQWEVQQKQRRNAKSLRRKLC